MVAVVMGHTTSLIAFLLVRKNSIKYFFLNSQKRPLTWRRLQVGTFIREVFRSKFHGSTGHASTCKYVRHSSVVHERVSRDRDSATNSSICST